jgi:hypothetical protein
MAYNFPDSPTPGQVFNQWTWNGSAWVLTPPTITAANIPFTPTGDIAATNVQAAIAEVDTEMHAAVAGVDLTSRVAKVGDTMTGHLVLPTGPAASNAVRKDYVDAADALALPKAGGTVTGELVAGAGYIRMTTSGTGGYFQWGGGGAYNCGGQTIYHSGNFTPSSYLSNGRIAYAGDFAIGSNGAYTDSIAHGVVTGSASGFDYSSTMYIYRGFRCRYVQGITTGWFTFPMA